MRPYTKHSKYKPRKPRTALVLYYFIYLFIYFASLILIFFNFFDRGRCDTRSAFSSQCPLPINFIYNTILHLLLYIYFCIIYNLYVKICMEMTLNGQKNNLDLLNMYSYLYDSQGRSQPHSPEWARVPLSSNFHHFFFLFFLKLCSFLSSFWLSGWATRPPGKALRH